MRSGDISLSVQGLGTKCISTQNPEKKQKDCLQQDRVLLLHEPSLTECSPSQDEVSAG